MSNPLLVAASRAALTLAVVGCGNSSNNSDANPSGDGNNSNPDGVGPSSGSGRYFDHGFFYDDVSQTPVAANSKTIIAALRAKGGWGAGDVMRIDNTIEVVDASAASPRAPYEPREVSVDCDEAPVPIPAGGNIEGEPGYTCSNLAADCHLLVWAQHEKKLYEIYQANLVAGKMQGTCLVVWDTAKKYPASGRGEQCTSADAAGFPIAPLLFSADEVKAGKINHAIRFILPNDRIREGYVHPATHGTRTTGSAGAPYYGVHLRLRADYNLASLPSEGARVVARAMQTYGMYHADGGNIALTAQSDTHTTAKWAGLLDPRDLAALKVEDFEVIDHGPAMPVTFDCVRN